MKRISTSFLLIIFLFTCVCCATDNVDSSGMENNPLSRPIIVEDRNNTDSIHNDNIITGSNDEAVDDDVAGDITDNAPDNIVSDIIAVEIHNIRDFSQEMSSILDVIAENFNAASISLAYFEGEHFFLTYQYGFADKSNNRFVDVNTKFRVASLSKLITAIIIMRLIEYEVLSLDEDISDYFNFHVRNPDFPNNPITIRMLLQHTSSIVDSDDFRTSRFSYEASTLSTSDLLKKRSSFSNRVPGTRYSYSNFGIAVLGSICELVTGQSFDTLARKLLFEPMGIDAAFVPGNLSDTSNIAVIYNENHGVSRSVAAELRVGESPVLGHSHHLPQGNLTISAIDYAQILAMLVNGGIFNDIEILSEESVKEIHNANVNAGRYNQGFTVRYTESGFMSSNIFWHTGSMYGEFTQFIYCLETSRGIVAVTTGKAGERDSNRMIIVCNKLSEPFWNMR